MLTDPEESVAPSGEESAAPINRSMVLRLIAGVRGL
jgi:hypothetical protein